MSKARQTYTERFKREAVSLLEKKGNRSLAACELGVHVSLLRKWEKTIKQNGIVCSMSRKGNCWDKAVVESFFSTRERECVQSKRYLSRAEAGADLFHFIEICYNRKRRHSTLGCLGPAAFELRATAGA